MQTTLSGVAWRRIAWVVLGILVLAAGLWLLARIPRTAAVFLTAGCIALGVHPVTAFLERRMNRSLAITTVYLCLFAATVFIGLLVIPATVVQTQALIASAPSYLRGAETFSHQAQDALNERFGHALFPSAATDLQRYVTEHVTAALTSVFTSLPMILVSTFTALFVGISAIILSMFFLARGDQIATQMVTLVPRSRRHEARTVLHEVASIFGGFVAAQAALCAITGVSIFVAAALLHVQFALLIGVFCAVAYAVPFVGMLVAQIVAAVLVLPQGWGAVTSISIVIFVVARIADNVLVPKIMGPSLGVSPIAVMFAVFAGGELFGIPGLLLGIPAAALAKVLWRLFVAPYIARRDLAPLVDELERVETLEVTVRETIVERPAG